ncbi:MAG: chromosome segregation ATPase [Lentimonas sp.]|jgi:chromosome segregation ATPase
MKTTLLLALALGAPIASTSLHAADSLQDTRNVLDQWVQTRQITSKETSDWQLEESILTDTQSLLANELDRLNETLKTLESSASAADEDRSQLTEKKEHLTAASAVVESTIGDLEMQMKQIIATLPEPLVNKIKPLIRRLPEDPASTKLSLGERVQNIVGILSQADKFNATITETSESREISKGKVVEVRTLYWGLAMAYYVDANGTYAGIGYPTGNGWEWPQIDGAGAAIQDLLNVYEGSEDIQFVQVPARIN